MGERFVKLPLEILRRQDLSVLAKLVYAVILDRMNSNGEAWPGLRRIAADLGGFSASSIHAAVHQLAEKELLELVPCRRGQRLVYKRSAQRTLCDNDSVRHDEHLDQEEVFGTANGVFGTPNSVFGRANTSVRQSEHNQTDSLTRLTNQTISPKRASKCRWKTSDLETIYQAYPRHVGKRTAVKAIGHALDRVAKTHAPPSEPMAWLLDRTQAYAVARTGQDQQYTPYPSTWFNQERYHDDPEQWKPSDQTRRDVSRIPAPPGKYDGIETVIHTGYGPDGPDDAGPF